MAMLFSTFNLGGVQLKNRIVMAPMCTYSCMSEDGIVDQWHIIHYGARAAGQVGMIILEATAVTPKGRISLNDLGLWDDSQIPGMQGLVQAIIREGCVAGVQLGHAGRKAGVREPGLAPSAIAFSEKAQVPEEMNLEHIKQTVIDFRKAAFRAKEAGFQVIELHGAHGYLINQFLSPLGNQRTDQYGGNPANRYRLLGEIVDAVKEVWDGPLVVRLSVEEYHPDGNHPQDYLYVVNRLKEQGVNLIDCSSGAVVPAQINVFPGYQVPFAEYFRREAGIPIGVAGLITSPLQAEEIVGNNRADLVLLGRELLRNPNWPIYAAQELKVKIKLPHQYERGWI
jgi:NADPH2 dehydrogenase